MRHLPSFGSNTHCPCVAKRSSIRKAFSQVVPKQSHQRFLFLRVTHVRWLCRLTVAATIITYTNEPTCSSLRSTPENLPSNARTPSIHDRCILNKSCIVSLVDHIQRPSNNAMWVRPHCVQHRDQAPRGPMYDQLPKRTIYAEREMAMEDMTSNAIMTSPIWLGCHTQSAFDKSGDLRRAEMCAEIRLFRRKYTEGE